MAVVAGGGHGFIRQTVVDVSLVTEHDCTTRQENGMERGNVVMFREPAEDEIGVRFVVVEMRGPRVLVALMDSDFAIVPTFVYAVEDLERVA